MFVLTGGYAKVGGWVGGVWSELASAMDAETECCRDRCSHLPLPPVAISLSVERKVRSGSTAARCERSMVPKYGL